jgi:hypothetical protein
MVCLQHPVISDARNEAEVLRVYECLLYDRSDTTTPAQSARHFGLEHNLLLSIPDFPNDL